MTQLSLTFRNWQLMTGAVGRCLAFDLTIENTAKRSVGFLSYEFELWQVNGHFLQVRFSHSDWDKLLNDIGFRHPVIDRLRWPNLPPAFQQSERNLIDAWKHYRAGLPHECLSACYKAFECLGFNLFADEKLQ